MHEETHDAIDKFIDLVRQHHPEDVAELRLLFFPLPISDGPPDLTDADIEPEPEPVPEDYEVRTAFPPTHEPSPQVTRESCQLTDALLDLARTRRFTFGKHGPKGGVAKTIYEVYVQDPSYLSWALENVDRLDFQLRQIITALINAIPTKKNASSRQDQSSDRSVLPSGWGQPA